MFKKLKAENLEQYFLKLIKNRKPEGFEKFLLCVLFVASRFYRMAVQIRIWMYEKRIIRNRSIGCLVVSIGNVSCGGTGKTPVVEVFARSLTEQGRRVAILSRGYRSKSLTFWEKLEKRFAHKKIELPPRIVSDGNEVMLNPREAGDEPYMLASNLQKVA
ncbi:MAG: tetraacyldisaccharide 4'-kinase, partial [Lentisphaeria bacterium]|nr:tetraacyldisaccharide 4'-kinase [Lentisphaeria bacterium]